MSAKNYYIFAVWCTRLCVQSCHVRKWPPRGRRKEGKNQRTASVTGNGDQIIEISFCNFSTEWDNFSRCLGRLQPNGRFQEAFFFDCRREWKFFNLCNRVNLKIYMCVCVYLYAIYYKISYAILIYNFAISQNPISSLCFCLFLERVS